MAFETKQPRPTLLAVLAHPDDETFGMGGTLALYARKGVDVYLVCATRGEVGEVDPQYLKMYQSIGELREDELRCASRKLGLKEVFFLNYRDSGMPGSPHNSHPDALAAAPLDEVAERVVCFIRQLRPQVVITFDPIGGYRHPDHIAIHKATVRAFELTGNPDFSPDSQPAYTPQRLFFQTIGHTFLRIGVKILPIFGQDPRHYGQNKDIDLVSIAEVKFPTHAIVDYSPVSAIRDEAARCHESQGGANMTSGFQGMVMRMIRGKETYMQGYPDPDGSKPVRDLFAGVDVMR